MNRRTEDRLRAAFDAKADQVTEDRLARLAEQRRRSLVGDLADGGKSDDFATIPGFGEPDPADAFEPHDPVTRLDVGHPAGSPRHARWFAPLLAAAAVVAVAVGVTAVSNSVNNGKRTPNPPATQASTPTPAPTQSSIPPRPSGTGSSTPSATATPPAQTAWLGHGQQADRSQIPWSQVGPGWTLALWTPSTTIDKRTQSAVTRDVPESLFLVNPVGGRYLVTTLPVEQAPPEYRLSLIDWSGDGKRALFRRWGEAKTFTILELNLGTGDWHEFDVAGNASFNYTKPLGLAILLHRDNGTERVSLDGSRQLLYPTTLPGGGKVGGALYTPDGSHLIRGTDAGWVVTANDGSVVRTLARPDGIARCRFHRWWTDTTYLATCYPGPLDDDPRLWLLPITGETPTPLMAQQSGETKFADAIRAGSRTFLERDAHCGTAGISVLQPNGEIRPLDISGRLGQRQGVQIFQATRQVLYLSTNLGCGQNQRVLSYDPRTDELTTLLGGSVNGGSILWALPYRATDPPR